MEAGNKIALERALAQGKRAEQLQTQRFEEKRKKQRNGLIRSGEYDPAWNQAVRDYHDGKDTLD